VSRRPAEPVPRGRPGRGGARRPAAAAAGMAAPGEPSPAATPVSYHSPMRSPTLVPQSGTTLYSQVAGALRGRIVRGDWETGHEIPTLDELCEQYGVARVTARQAIQLLVAEGLLSSHRGRRTVVVGTGGDLRKPLYPALAAPLEQVTAYSVTVLEKDDDATLPESLGPEGRSAGTYVRVRKVDREAGVPYCLSDIYVPKALFRRFPRDAASSAKLARLVRDTARPPLVSARERIGVSSADVEEARWLGCPLSAPVARVQRLFTDGDGRIVYAGWSVYRGDRFFVERELIDLVRRG
jgi:GntR family transcriptional regulator